MSVFTGLVHRGRGTACGGGILYPPVASRRQPPLGKVVFVKKEFLYIMKATGIVRRIEARVIITQKCDKAL